MNINKIKTCSKCGEEKAYSEFHKKKRNYDGLQSCCKICKTKENYSWFINGGEAVVKAYQKTKAFRESVNKYLATEPPAVYALENMITKEVYIGQSRKPVARRTQHNSDLSAGRHPNSNLQQSYDLFGSGCFQFKILEYCDSLDELETAEKKWIKRYSHYAFNIQHNR
jgi:hypothetical protein